MGKEKLAQINPSFISAGAAKLSHDDFEKVIKKEDEIQGKFKDGPLKKYIEDAKTFFEMVRDYINGTYREVPWWAISAIVFALLYVLSPIDLIPDMIPVIGQIDDAAVIGLCIMMVREEVARYRTTKGVAA